MQTTIQTTKKALGLVLMALAAVPAFAVDAPGAENTACQSQWQGGDFVQFSCPIPVRDAKQLWRFKADFSGGHDDTSASMTVTLNAAPLECEPGSKTRLFGEDGDVSLVCYFRASSAGTKKPVLGVALLWSHGQYVRTELVAD